jgi:DNA-binding MarR family transcriptional regulator
VPARVVPGTQLHKTPDDIAELAARLRLSTTRLARRLRSEADIGLSPSLLSALASVHVHGPLTLGLLAEHEGVAPPTITKVVARLEEQALVERLPDAADRRVCRVRTTTTGEDLLAASRDRKTAWLAGRVAAMDDDQFERLRSAIDVLEELALGESP